MKERIINLETPISQTDPLTFYLFTRFVYSLSILEKVIESKEEGISYQFECKTTERGKETKTVQPYPYPDFINGIKHCVFSLYEDLKEQGGQTLADEYLKLNEKKVGVPKVFKNAFK